METKNDFLIKDSKEKPTLILLILASYSLSFTLVVALTSIVYMIFRLI